MNQSIQYTLRKGLFAGLIGTFFVLWLMVNQTIRILSEFYVTDRLEQEIESILTELALDDKDSLQIDEKEIDTIFHHSFSGHYFQITLSHGEKNVQTFRSRSLGMENIAIPQVPVGETDHFFIEGPKNQSLMVLVKSFPIREYTMTIAVGEDRTPFLRHFQRFQWDFTLIASVLFLILVAIQVRWLHHAFQPMHRLLDEFKLLENGSVTRLRLEAPTEVAPLVIYINHILEMTEKQLDRSRNALGNLSHALKIPVTALIQLSEREELRHAPAIQEILKENLATLHNLIERQLKQARLGDPTRPGSSFILFQELPALVRTLKSIYYYKGLEIECLIGKEVTCRGNREDLLELIGNLADNACKWANRMVHIEAGQDAQQGFWLTVADDGPGCPEEELHCLQKRGTRLDESRGGHGLGLAIAQDVVAQYGGQMTFGRSEHLHGFLVRVTLPQ